MVDKIGDVEDATGTLISLPFYIFLLIFQSCVLGHFLYKIYGRELSNKIKFATLSVLLVAWLGLCFEFITILLNLSHPFPTQNGYCAVISWFRYNWFVIFEFTLYTFWIIRIYHTFKFSVFEIKFKYAILMVTLITIICLIFLISTTISMQPQYKQINFSISSQQTGYDCIPKWTIGGILSVYIIGQITTLLLNLFFASLFFFKLKKLQVITAHDTGGRASHLRELRLFQLMQKHTLLTFCSVFTSLLCWLFFDSLALSVSYGISQDMLFILSIDRVIKSLCIILMYKFYETLVTKLCGCCLRLTHIKCASTKIKELFPYFNPNPTIKTPTIYAQCYNIVTCEDKYGEDRSLTENEINEIKHELNHNSSSNPIELTNRGISPSPSPTPNRPLPNNPNNYRLAVRNNNNRQNSVPSISRDNSRDNSIEKALPQIDFTVKPYKMCNFIACLTTPQNSKCRYLDYSIKGYNVIATQIFNEIEMTNGSENNGMVIMNGFQFDQNKFSYLQKNKTKYPYKLAIRLKNHHEHADDAYKLLKYAEYKLNETFKKIKRNNSFDYEPYFDTIANDLACGKLIQNNSSNLNIEEFALQIPHISTKHIGGVIEPSRELSTSQYDHKSLPPITPVQSIDYQ
eukprot:458209_1